MSPERIHFVTGRLAEHSLRTMLVGLAARQGFEYTVDVLPISVAALMTPEWISHRLKVPDNVARVILPGYCEGDLQPVTAKAECPVQRGPRDLRQLPEWFSDSEEGNSDYGCYDIEILAEINHVPRRTHDDVLNIAADYRERGADVIDVGCEPHTSWSGIGDCVRSLRDAGHRVSIDSLMPDEIELAVNAGAELVLSVNATNRHAAPDWGCPVVAIPDDVDSSGGLEDTLEMLEVAGVPYRVDPVLEPIGIRFMASLVRYWSFRQQHPDVEMMMGIGNLTELTDVDSAGVNVLLLGICQELGIWSVLTTEVINWARTSVSECDLARRLVHYAMTQRIVAKHLEPRLVTLRDPQVYEPTIEELERLAEEIRDNNYRLFTSEGEIHLVAADIHLHAEDPFRLFERLLQIEPKNVDASHAFYLGYEMSKAATALTLSKQYRQDEALDWGYLTVPETHHRLSKSSRSRQLRPRSDENTSDSQ